MFVKNLGEIEAVAFDIDGTLYPSWSLTVKALPYYTMNCWFFMKYGLVRNEMHKKEPSTDFRKFQAEEMGRLLHRSPEEAEHLMETKIYEYLKRYFRKIKCFKYVPETFEKFKKAGLKLALLSDFPPEQKEEIWGVKDYCDVVLGTEAVGALKPDPHSFLELAKQLNVSPEKILYVGNSIKYDVKGAKNAGMKSAFILTGLRKLFRIPLKQADICFSDYRQLQRIVLE
ncbi:MAG: HAD family hydrolase [Treponema sp.]|nr:HAD family hydrolase [Treponema sp.]